MRSSLRSEYVFCIKLVEIVDSFRPLKLCAFAICVALTSLQKQGIEVSRLTHQRINSEKYRVCIKAQFRNKI